MCLYCDNSIVKKLRKEAQIFNDYNLKLATSCFVSVYQIIVQRKGKKRPFVFLELVYLVFDKVPFEGVKLAITVD